MKRYRLFVFTLTEKSEYFFSSNHDKQGRRNRETTRATPTGMAHCQQVVCTIDVQLAMLMILSSIICGHFAYRNQ